MAQDQAVDGHDQDVASEPALGLPGSEPIRVLVVDDHAVFRRGLQMVLEQEPDIEVVGEAGDGSEAVTMAANTAPDIVLLDVRMPKRGGIDACTAIKDAVPSVAISDGILSRVTSTPIAMPASMPTTSTTITWVRTPWYVLAAVLTTRCASACSSWLSLSSWASACAANGPAWAADASVKAL